MKKPSAPTSRELTEARLEELALKAEVDDRTILKLLAGMHVRGFSGKRAAKVLAEAGLLPG